jgi:hypothetical protein
VSAKSVANVPGSTIVTRTPAGANSAASASLSSSTAAFEAE